MNFKFVFAFLACCLLILNSQLTASNATFKSTLPNGYNAVEDVAVTSCAFTGTYRTSFFDNPSTFVVDTEVDDASNSINFFFLNQAGQYFSQSLNLDEQGNVLSENTVKSHGFSLQNISNDCNAHYVAQNSGGTLTFSKISSINGNTLWTKTGNLNGITNTTDYTVYESENNLLLVARNSVGYHAIITDLQGNITAQNFVEDSSQNSFINFVSTSDNGFILQRSAFGRGGSTGFIKLNANAEVVFNVSGGGDTSSNIFELIGLARDNSGFYFSGSSNMASAPFSNTAFLRKYDIFTGEVIWDRRIITALPPNSIVDNINQQFVDGVVRTPDGGALVSYRFGAVNQSEISATIIVRYNSDGSVSFTREYTDQDIPNNIDGGGISEAVNGGFFFEDFSNTTGLSLAKFNNAGLASPQCASDNSCTVTATSSNGNITISGMGTENHTQLYDSNIEWVWGCNPWEANRTCPSSETVTDLETGATYYLSVQQGNCDEWIPITVEGGGNTSNTCDVTVSSANGNITISGMGTENQTQLYDSNIEWVWGCNPWDSNRTCPSSETVTGLENGATYYLSVQRGNCDEWIPITVEGGGNTDDNTCNVTASSANGNIIINGMSADNHTQLYDSNIEWVWGCNPWESDRTCPSNETVTGLVNGATYYLSVQRGNCDEWIPITVQGGGNGGGCTDSDRDGVCDYEDCEPLNSARPAVVGSSCNDFDSNTTNDQIQSDGCTCLGTPTDVGCNVAANPVNGGINITGLPSDANTKLFDSNLDVVWTCNPWQGSPCSGSETITGLPGATYFLSVNSDNCNEWISVNVEAGNADCQPVNWAIGRPTSQSSTLFENGVNASGNKAVDGSTIGEFSQGSVSSTQLDFQGWWQMDLEFPRKIRSIEIYNRTDGTTQGTPRLRNFIVMISDTPFVGSFADMQNQAIASEIYDNGIPAGNPSTWFLDTPVTGRYVRIQRFDWGYVTMAEVNVLACIGNQLVDNEDYNNILAFSETNDSEVAPFKVTNLFPNPTADDLILQVDTEKDAELSLQIVNGLGQIVGQNRNTIEVGNNTMQIDMQDYPKGIYNVVISDGENTISKKVVKL